MLPVVAVVVIAITTGAVAQQTPLQGSTCTPATYSGTLCSQFINYPVGLSAAAQAAAEATLKTSIGQLSLLKSVPECQSAIYRLTCAALFPRCDPAGTIAVACQSSCMDMYKICAPQLQNVKLPVTILDTVFNQCTKLSTDDTEPWGPSGACVDYTTTSNSTTAVIPTALTGPAACPGIFKPRTNNATNKNCDDVTGCCIPCPAIKYFMPEGTFDTIFVIQTYGCLVSALLSAWIVLSWAILPGRRQHPSDIVLHFSIALMLWMCGYLIPIGNAKRIQCSDDVTTATPSTNGWCGVQSAWLLFFVNASIILIGYMIGNLHAVIFWRSNFCERRRVPIIVLCWTLPLFLTGIPFFTTSFSAEVGLDCNIIAKDINLYEFGIPSIIASVSMVLTIINTWKIVSVTLKAASNNGGVGTSSTRSWGNHSSNGSESETEGQGQTKALSRRQMIKVLKTNWRSVLLSFIFITIVLTTVVFFNVVIMPFSRIDQNTPWIAGWKACMTTPGNDQNTCAQQFASNVPSLAAFIVLVMLIATPGLWLFLIFGVNSRLYQDWKELLFPKRRRMPSPEEDPDEEKTLDVEY